MCWETCSVAVIRGDARPRLTGRRTVATRDKRPQAWAPARILDGAAADGPRGHRARAAGRAARVRLHLDGRVVELRRVLAARLGWRAHVAHRPGDGHRADVGPQPGHD